MIEISTAALGEVFRLRAKVAALETSALRLEVEASGCSGWSYQLDFEASPRGDDHVFECGDLQVVVSPRSLPYLNGLAVDYSEDLMGGSFRFKNPNATTSCSCGYSFAVASVD